MAPCPMPLPQCPACWWCRRLITVRGDGRDTPSVADYRVVLHTEQHPRGSSGSLGIPDVAESASAVQALDQV